MLLACLVAATAAGDGGVLSQYSLEESSFEQYRLPGRLNEISALALTNDGRLFAVADEEAVVYELGLEQGKLLKAFALGDPIVRGDFEGLAWADGRFWLLTSGGDLYSAREGGDGEQVGFDKVETGLGARCELEGLAADPRRGNLLIACKEPRGSNTTGAIMVHAWSIAGAREETALRVDLPVSAILRHLGSRRINPSGIVVHPGSGHLLLIASRQKALVELAPDGRLVAARRLPLASHHRQPEGIELLGDGRLLIADEGGNHRARLAVYTADREQE